MTTRHYLMAGGAIVALVAILAGWRAFDRYNGARNEDLRVARATADSLRKVVKADSLRSADAHHAELLTRAPQRAAVARSDAAVGRSDTQLARLVEAQDAAKRALEDSLAGVVQLAENLRRLNEEATKASIAFMQERAEWKDERAATARRTAALETAAATDADEKAHLREEVLARERELAAQDKALRCRIGPFPCPSRLTSFILGAGSVAVGVAALVL